MMTESLPHANQPSALSASGQNIIGTKLIFANVYNLN